ncbi:serine--tRNA ligase [Schlesneria sp. DSM 10557]|uniref:serine--tRNA ligase n=2 Tax=unclassified Schlesneria TaxID=2762017 RepID=UPI0035A07148
MLDLQFVCENLDAVRANCQNRHVNADLDRLLELRDLRSQLIVAVDKDRQRQNEIAQAIPKEKSPDTKKALIDEGKSLKQSAPANEARLKEVEADVRAALMTIPNMTHPVAPIGEEADSVTVRTWGQKPEFSFKPLDHVALAEKHGLIDLEAGSRVAGHGFYFLKNEAVLLELALTQFAIRKLVEHGFTLHTTPDLAKLDVLEGTGYQPRGNETQIYSIAGMDLCLVATAEIPLGGIHRDQILDLDKLPLKYAGVSHCFRTEAGAHGKATRGIYRVHQFTKVEMFGFTAPDVAASDALHAEIVQIEEEIFQGLGIPYRVLDIASGDLGGSAYRKFDLEAWMPGRGEAGEWGEVTSASNCTDFQARRLGIRCKSPDWKGTRYVHTLNGTAIAVTRAIIAILENYQQADGSIVIPEVLRPWVGKEKIG